MRKQWYKRAKGEPRSRDLNSFVKRASIITQEETAELLGVSREAIRQTERRALWKLRNNEELRKFYLCWTRFDK